MTDANAADSSAQRPQQQQQQQRMSIRIDESHMATAYANTIRTTTTLDEVVLDFGLNMPTSAEGEPPTAVFTVGARVVLNWSGAKRLAASLARVVQAHEAQHGEIPV
ncbi:MAG: DUF3467 domain-containing protein [Planctomycetota bacterium]|nr:MAG: DUF3467 domain-containing protein [Planctomycetota bacterium]